MYKDCFKLMDINKVLHHTLELGNEGDKFCKFDKPIFLFRSLISFVQDGTIDKNDLRGAFDNVGVLMTESELDELLGEVAFLLLFAMGVSFLLLFFQGVAFLLFLLGGCLFFFFFLLGRCLFFFYLLGGVFSSSFCQERCLFFFFLVGGCLFFFFVFLLGGCLFFFFRQERCLFLSLFLHHFDYYFKGEVLDINKQMSHESSLH